MECWFQPKYTSEGNKSIAAPVWASSFIWNSVQPHFYAIWWWGQIFRETPSIYKKKVCALQSRFVLLYLKLLKAIRRVQSNRESVGIRWLFTCKRWLFPRTHQQLDFHYGLCLGPRKRIHTYCYVSKIISNLWFKLSVLHEHFLFQLSKRFIFSQIRIFVCWAKQWRVPNSERNTHVAFK